jgi:hypothetical protein
MAGDHTKHITKPIIIGDDAVAGQLVLHQAMYEELIRRIR